VDRHPPKRLACQALIHYAAISLYNGQ
jgi:hypothetical protein